MSADGSPDDGGSEAATVVRRLDSPSSATLAGHLEVLDELQTVLRCCERLVGELASPTEGTDVVVEALWTTALLSYARCFAERDNQTALSEADVAATQPDGDLLPWHRALLALRGHYADPRTDPREQFSVGAVQDEEGRAGGVAVTSSRQPQVNDLTVRQTGAIVFALTEVVDRRIEQQQATVLDELRAMDRAELDNLDPMEVLTPSGAA